MRLSARTAHSFVFFPLLASLARSAALICSLARSLTHSRAHWKLCFVYEMNPSISYSFNPLSAVCCPPQSVVQSFPPHSPSRLVLLAANETLENVIGVDSHVCPPSRENCRHIQEANSQREESRYGSDRSRKGTSSVKPLLASAL